MNKSLNKKAYKSIRQYHSLQPISHSIQYVPWSVTISGLRAYNKIVEFYNFVRTEYPNTPLADFIERECKFLVEPVTNENPYYLGKINTGYPVATFNVDSMVNSKNLLDYTDWTNLSKLHKAGNLTSTWVYCFFTVKFVPN